MLQSVSIRLYRCFWFVLMNKTDWLLYEVFYLYLILMLINVEDYTIVASLRTCVNINKLKMVTHVLMPRCEPCDCFLL